MTTIPTITALPTPSPTTADPTNFATRADALLAALPDMVTEENLAIAAMNTVAMEVSANATTASGAATTAQTAAAAAGSASTLMDTSSSSLSISAGAKSLAYASSGRTFANGDDIVLIRRSDPGTRMHGAASSVDNTAKTMTVTVGSSGFNGSGGPYTDWLVIEGALAALIAGAAADLLLGSSGIAALTPAAIYNALAEVTLTDAATIAVDMSTFINAKVTLGGNRTLGNPTNAKPGQSGRIRVIQDGTGSRTLAFSSNWKRQGGAPTLTTTAAAWDAIVYDVIDATTILYDLIKNPT